MTMVSSFLTLETKPAPDAPESTEPAKVESLIVSGFCCRATNPAAWGLYEEPAFAEVFREAVTVERSITVASKVVSSEA